MSIGKRTSTSDPLTEHDVADRLDKAALRTLRILMDTRQISPEFFAAVKSSRYYSGVVRMLRDEIDLWHPREPES